MMGLPPTILSNILKARIALKHRQVRFKIKLSVNRSIRTRYILAYNTQAYRDF